MINLFDAKFDEYLHISEDFSIKAGTSSSSFTMVQIEALHCQCLEHAAQQLKLFEHSADIGEENVHYKHVQQPPYFNEILGTLESYLDILVRITTRNFFKLEQCIVTYFLIHKLVSKSDFDFPY